MSTDVRLCPADVLEHRNPFWIVVSSILGWDAPTETEKDGGVTVRQFTNGLSNDVFEVRRLETGSSAIVRIFGSESPGSVHVFELLGAAGLAPLSLGRFANGRVEEFLSGYSPIETLLVMEQHAQGIAKEMAKFHEVATRALDEAGFRPEALTARIRRWRAEVEALGLDDGWVRDGLMNVDVEDLLGSMHEFEGSVLHGDLQGLNIMVNDSSVRFIDFEFICKGPIAFDLSNHFAEWSWSGDYSVLDFRAERCPGLCGRRRFIQVYAAARGLTGEGIVDELLAQTDVCLRVSHLHWALWGVLEGVRRRGAATWDYLGYAQSRYAALVE